MPVPFLLIVMVIVLIFCILCFVEGNKKSGIVLGSVFASIAIWIFVGFLIPRTIKYESVYKIENVGNGNNKTQIIVIPEEEMKIVNLNSLLGKTFPEGSKIKRIVWQDVYCGIKFDNHIEYVAVTE